VAGKVEAGMAHSDCVHLSGTHLPTPPASVNEYQTNARNREKFAVFDGNRRLSPKQYETSTRFTSCHFTSDRVEFDKQGSNSAACDRDVKLMGHARPMSRATDPSVHKYCGHNVRR